MRPICIMGMHRSGTSVVGKAVELLGLSLGQDLMEGVEFNAKGLFENRGMTGLSHYLMREIGVDWKDPIMLKPSFVNCSQAKVMRPEAEKIIKQEFGDGRVAWKDPRASLTLPFFREILGDTLNIICIRNPIEVCDSLNRREKMKVPLASQLWRTYTTSAILNSRDLPHIYVYREDMIADPVRELRRIAKFLDIECTAAMKKTFRLWNDNSLHHHSRSLLDVYSTEGMDQRAIMLYTLLQMRKDSKPASLEQVCELLTPEIREAWTCN